MSYWEIGYEVDGKWEFKGRYSEPGHAMCAVTFETGVASIGDLHENGTYEVKACDDGRRLACVRFVDDTRTTPPGGTPQGRLG